MDSDIALLKSQVSEVLKRDFTTYLTSIPEESAQLTDSILDSSMNYSLFLTDSGRSPDSFSSSLPVEAFKIRNIDTGEELDLRDENKEVFYSKASKIFMQDEGYFKARRKMNEELWEAVERNDYELVEDLLDTKKHGNLVAHPNAKGLNDWNALHMAASDGFVAVADLLVEKGDHTDIDARTSINRTPLHLATLHNHLEVVKILICSGADINAVDNEYNTALHYASMQGFIEILKWLLQKDPRVDIVNHLGRLAFDLALNYQVVKCFKRYFYTKFIEKINTNYSRIVIGSTLLHNSREDHINKILLKASNAPRLRDLQTFNDRPKFNSYQSAKSLKDLRLPNIGHVGPKDFKALLQLGKGSFGEVYLVEKCDTKVQYALKILRKEKILNSNLIKYAFAERNILLNITHPFIVKLNFAFQTSHYLAMVMDYCPNGDLGMHISREKEFSEEKARFYAIEVLLALEELHKHNIIFRDLKPDNVVLDSEGHARLTDFGLSKQGMNIDQLSKSFCGSVAYLAPEMLKRAGHNKSVDWYLFGVLLFEMLVGTPPYYSTSREQLFNNIQNAKLKIPSTMSQAARDLIKNLLHRDPKKRLGASSRDAEEVKQHIFFKNVDWGLYLNKKVQPPAFKPTKRVIKEISLEKVYLIRPDEENSEKPRLDGWSVLVPSE